MLNIMKKLKRARIALYLPEGIQVSRKSGTLIKPRVLHDAGIIYGKNTDIVVAVMSFNIKGKEKVVAQIGKLAYDHLDKP